MASETDPFFAVYSELQTGAAPEGARWARAEEAANPAPAIRLRREKERQRPIEASGAG